MTWYKIFFILSTFDPNGPPVENWWFLAYFGIVPLEVEDCVLPMIELVSLAVWTKFFQNFFQLKFLPDFFTTLFTTLTDAFTTPLQV